MKNLRNLPQIDKFVKNELFSSLSPSLVLKLSKKVINECRDKLLNKECLNITEQDLMQEVLNLYKEVMNNGIQPLINATGIVVHTNLGRSRISDEIYDKAKSIICNYSDLEYDIQSGLRGERYSQIESLLKILFDTEDVLIVNNNAAAVFLILNTFAKNKDVVVSRGELVEIGGSFRIPSVMKESGAILKEVGTTNKTKIDDYIEAINENTSMLMKVHQSNFTIEGFSESVLYESIKSLSESRNLIDYYDLGSGHVGNLPFNLSVYEDNLEDILKQKPSLISFSGDKLFGSVQSGIILGKKQLIEKLKKNQLLRMLRVDKTTLAFLQETIKAYITNDLNLITTRKLLQVNISELKQRVANFCEKLKNNTCESVESYTYVGGGAFPNKKIPTIALKISGEPQKLEKRFRNSGVIGRIENNHFLLDFRSIDEKEDNQLLEIVNKTLKSL